jgi:hypothetical protein
MIKYKLDEEQLTTLYNYTKQNRFDIQNWIRYYNANERYVSLRIISDVFQDYSDNVRVSFKQLHKKEILDKKSWKSIKPKGIVALLGNRRFMYFIDRLTALPMLDLGILEVFETTEYTKPKKRYYKTSTPF